MADRKISELTNITGANLANADEFVVVDTSADETKAITFDELKNALDTGTGFVRITGDTMSGALTINSDLTVNDNDATPIVLQRAGGTDANTNIRFAQSSYDTYVGTGLTGSFVIGGTADLAASRRFAVDQNADVRFYDDSSVTKMRWFAAEESLEIGAIQTGTNAPLSVKTNGSGHAISIEENSGAETWQIGVNVDGNLNFWNSGATNTPTVAFIDNGSAVFNEVGAAADFRVESDNATHMFFVDGSANKIGINTSAPIDRLHMRYDSNNSALQSGLGTTDNSAGGIRIENINQTSGAFSGLMLRTYTADAKLVNVTNGTSNKALVKLFVDTDSSWEAMRWDGHTTTPQVVVNEGGINADFRVETPSYANALFVDASENKTFINTPESEIASKLTVNNKSITGHLQFQTAFNESPNDYVRANIVFSRDKNQIIWDDTTDEWVHAGGSSTDWSMMTHTAGEFRLYHGPSYANETRWSNSDFKTNFRTMEIENANGWKFDAPQGGGFVFNDRGLDRDFRVESDAHSYAFFVNGENGGVQMGGGSQLSVGTPGEGRLNLVRTNGSPQLGLFRADTSISAGDTLGIIGAYSNDTTSNSIKRLAKIDFAADGAFSAGDNPTKIVFYTTEDATETNREIAKFDNRGTFFVNRGGVFNEDGSAANNADFRVESDSNANMLFVDASNNGVGIGTNNPVGALTVIQSGNANDQGIRLQCNDDGGSTAPDIQLYKNSATPADDDNIGAIWFRGNDSAGDETTYAAIYGVTRDVSNASEDGSISFGTVNNGTFAVRSSIHQNGVYINPEGICLGTSDYTTYADANTLRDYEEGNWSPTFSNAFLEGAFANATGFSTMTGRYVKIGALVHCWCRIQSINGSSGNLTGDDNFSFTTASLPFTPTSDGSDFNQVGGYLTVYQAVGSGNNASGPIISLNGNASIVAQVTAISNNVTSTSARYQLNLTFKTNS